MRRSVFIGMCLFCLAHAAAFAQTRPDSLHSADSLKPLTVKKTPPPAHSPKKAALLSAVLPGAGQAFNHKYWKIPVIYAGGAGLGYFFWYEQTTFDFFTKAYHQSLAHNYSAIDPSLRNYTADDLLSQKNRFNRYRDLSVIAMTALYVLNILDATVDAHLWHFEQNISDDLTLRTKPTAIPLFGSPLPAPGLSLTLSFH
jgi:hypothetical protein